MFAFFLGSIGAVEMAEPTLWITVQARVARFPVSSPTFSFGLTRESRPRQQSDYPGSTGPSVTWLAILRSFWYNI
jgi:hypothetical protein